MYRPFGEKFRERTISTILMNMFRTALRVALVSAASLITSRGNYRAATTRVYHERQGHIYLIHIDNNLFYPEKKDVRRSGDFMAAMHNTLGITGEPQWYPCDIP